MGASLIVPKHSIVLIRRLLKLMFPLLSFEYMHASTEGKLRMFSRMLTIQESFRFGMVSAKVRLFLLSSSLFIWITCFISCKILVVGVIWMGTIQAVSDMQMTFF